MSGYSYIVMMIVPFEGGSVEAAFATLDEAKEYVKNHKDDRRGIGYLEIIDLSTLREVEFLVYLE